MHLELVSFSLCPYVQRAVITLLEKKADFETTYIDLNNPPEWFHKISPLGQVPLLRVKSMGASETVLFESAVICEYLDEVVGPALHVADPLLKAKDRAWIEYGSYLLGQLYAMTTATDAVEVQKIWDEFLVDLQRVEPQLGDGPYWRGLKLTLVDAAWAPLWMRLKIFPKPWKEIQARAPQAARWGEALLACPVVQKSVHTDFETEYLNYLRHVHSAWLTRS